MNPQYPIRLNTSQVEIIDAILSNKVSFLVIGGWAIASYISERTTFDLDILISRTRGNAIRVETALKQIKNLTFPLGLNLRQTLTESEKRIFIPDDGPNKLVDILTSIKGVDFGDFYRASKVAYVGLREVRVCSPHDLLKMKEISLKLTINPKYQLRDIADIKLLKKFLGV